MSSTLEIKSESELLTDAHKVLKDALDRTLNRPFPVRIEMAIGSASENYTYPLSWDIAIDSWANQPIVRVEVNPLATQIFCRPEVILGLAPSIAQHFISLGARGDSPAPFSRRSFGTKIGAIGDWDLTQINTNFNGLLQDGIPVTDSSRLFYRVPVKGAASASPSPVQANSSGFIHPPYYKLLQGMVDDGQHVIMPGPPGVGKSFAVEQLAKERGIQLFNLNCDVRIGRAHLEGALSMKNGTTSFKRSGFADAVVNGHWAKLDELTSADPDGIICINGIVENPKVINLDGEQIPVHKDFRLFITYNPGSGRPLPDSLEDRFFTIPVSHPDEATTLAILAGNGIVGDTQRPIAEFAKKSWEKFREKKLRYALSFRGLANIHRMLKAGHSWDDAINYAVRSKLRSGNDDALVVTISEEIKAMKF